MALENPPRHGAFKWDIVGQSENKGIFQLAMLDSRRVAVLVMFEGMFDKCLMQLGLLETSI